MTKTKSLREKYNEEVKSALKEKFGYTNDMMIPKLSKIVINMGVGEASHNSKIAESIQAQLSKIAGQHAVVTKAKKSIASYKLREGMPVGAMATLRGERMYDFLQKLICIILPRIRDFRGISAKSFDGRGNYTLGLKEQSLFPEISYEEVDLVKGMNISIITTANTDDEARYGITNEGRNCLSYFFNRIPQSRREAISTFAKEKRMEFKRSQEYVSDYQKNEDGSYTITLRIKEPSLTSPLLEVKMRAPNRNSAVLTCKKWNEQAPNVFEYLYDTLISK